MILKPMNGPTFVAPPTQSKPEKPDTTVFVGNIPENCSNEFMEQLFRECGEISNWKRTVGVQGKVNSFGFCDFKTPEGTLRALHILNDFQIGERKLLVKVDDKVREDLRSCITEKRKQQGKPTLHLLGDELPVDEDDHKRNEQARVNLRNWIKTDYPDLLQCEVLTSLKEVEEYTPQDDVDVDLKKATLSTRSNDISRSKNRNGRRRSRSGSLHRNLRRRRSASSSSSGNSAGSTTSPPFSPKCKPRSGSNDSDAEREQRKVLKRRLKAKAKSYEAHLKKWEKREREMFRHYESLDRAERNHLNNVRAEERKLRRFLEEYNDCIHDAIFYNRREFIDRRRAYELEREDDLKDRLSEEAEINQIKEQLMKANVDEAIAMEMARKRHQEQEEATMCGVQMNSGRARVLVDQEESHAVSSLDKTMEVLANHDGKDLSSVAPVEIKDVSDRWKSVDSAVPSSPTLQSRNIVAGSKINFNSPTSAQKTVSQRIRGVFGLDEEDLNHTQRLRFVVSQEERLQSLTEEEKKQIMKGIIDNIPTGKDELFSTPILWEHLSNAIMEQRIRPWVTKKIKEFIGEYDKALCDFICESVGKNISPQKLLDDVAMIFDEDAEQFVMKMWRLIIYETESKKLGISKMK